MQGLVTVFGGSGFIGRYAVRALARNGWRIRVAIRRPHLAPELRVMGDVGQIELVQTNIRVADSVARALAESVAAVNLVGVLYEAGAQKFDAVHARGPALIAEACARAGITRLVQVSAIGADASSASAYARSKAAGEAAVRTRLPDSVILRPSVVFGAEDQFFNRFAAMAAVAPALPLIGGGKTRMQPVYAGDVGEAIVRSLEQASAGGRIFELGGPAIYTFKELMQLVLNETQRRRALVPLPFEVARLIGVAGDVLSAVLPVIPPPLTTDQVELLKRDNVVAPGALTLADLGVTPTAVEAVVPTYLWRFRPGGQFAQPSEIKPSVPSIVDPTR